MPPTEAEKEAARRYRVQLTRGCVIDGKDYRAGSVVELISKDAGSVVNSGKGIVVAKETDLHEAPSIPRQERVRILAERNAGNTRGPDGSVPGASDPEAPARSARTAKG